MVDFAEVVELVDTQVSKTCGLKNRDGSIPSFGTNEILVE
jgi:hypothetical protein